MFLCLSPRDMVKVFATLHYPYLALDLKRFGSIEPKRSIVIVVSPLLALMKDQVATYSAKGLSVGSVTHETTPEELGRVREGKYQLLFFSP